MFTAPPAKGEPSAPHDLRVMGDFVLLEEIGKGGFGAVFRAQHRFQPGEFAIKLIHCHHANEATLLLRFQREAHVLTMLQHPNIVKFVDIGHLEQEGLYLAMEFLRGKSLRRLFLKEYPLPLQRLKSLVSQLCDVLHFTHSKGILHRDLKPSNIIVCQQPQGEVVKLIDFGIAAVSEQTQLTQTGTFLGSPAYMPPEQVQGDFSKMGAPSDIYSLGVILIQLLTQRRPFEADNLTGYLAHHLFTVPPTLATLRPEVTWHPVLEACIARCLAKEPQNRYANGHALKDALLAALDAQGEIKLAPRMREEPLPSGLLFLPQDQTDAQKIPALLHMSDTHSSSLSAKSLLDPSNVQALEENTAQHISQQYSIDEAPELEEVIPSPSPSKWMIFAVFAVALLFGSAGLYTILSQTSETTPQKKQPNRSVLDHGGQVQLESWPSRAIVFKANQQICTTTCFLTGIVGDTLTLVVKKQGYYPRQVEVTYQKKRTRKFVQLIPLLKSNTPPVSGRSRPPVQPIATPQNKPVPRRLDEPPPLMPPSAPGLSPLKGLLPLARKPSARKPHKPGATRKAPPRRSVNLDPFKDLQ